MDGRVERASAPSHDGEHRSAKREQGATSEHRDVRVRAGPLGARSAAESSQPDVGSTVMPAQWFWRLFAETKVARSRQRAEPRKSCERSKWIPAYAGMTSDSTSAPPGR